MSNSRKSSPFVNPNPIDTLGYWRMSSDDQEASIQQQHAWGLDTCARDRLNLVGHDSDPGISGSEMDLRPGLKRIIALAQKLFRQGRPARRLLVWKANRLSRADSCDTHAFVIQPLRDAGITHVQTQDGRLIDLHNRNDLLLFNIEQDAQSAAYLASLASDVMRGKADIARQGYWNGGPIPLGYRAQQTGNTQFRRKLSRLVLAPKEEVELVQWLFRTYHESKTSCALLARELNRRGFRPKKAASWAPNCIAVILSNRTYLGEVRWNKTHVGKFCRLKDGVIQAGSKQGRDEVRRRKGLKTLPSEANATSDCIVVAGAHDRIIDPALFDAVQAKMASQAGRTSIREDRFYELADLVKCGHCGAKCWCIPNPRGGRPTRTKMQCSRHRKDGWEMCPESGTEHHGEILRRVLETLHRDLGDPTAREEVRTTLAQQTADTQRQIDSGRTALDKEIGKLEAKRAAEARRLLELPRAVLDSAAAAHQETLDALDRAKSALALLLREGQTTNTETVALAERAMANIDLLPALARRIKERQELAEDGDATIGAELLVARRKLRDALFGLVSCVRVFWLPVDAAGRKGKGKGHRKHVLRDVEVELHLHIQKALLNVSPNGTTNSHGSANVRITEPIILRFSSPFAA